MSWLEISAIAAAVGAALAYLGWRAWMLWTAQRPGSCAGCPVAKPKMRLADPPPREFTTTKHASRP